MGDEGNIVIPRYSLFKTAGVSRNSVKEFSSEARVTSNTVSESEYDTLPQFYATTVNLNPHGFVNNKKWSLYSQDDQRKILLRLEASMRRTYPTVELVELHFEVCPTLKSAHYHALYKMGIDMPSLYCQYFNDRVKKVGKKCTYENVKIDPIWNYEGWQVYMKKDQ